MSEKKRQRAPRSDKGKKRPKVADISSKRLISLVPTDWLRWVMQMPNIKALEVLDADFQWISRHSDALIKAHTPELGEFLVLNELQLHYTDKMPARMRAYTGLAREKSGLPVYPILINILQPSKGVVILDRYEEEFLGKKAVQEYAVINLWEVDAQIAFVQKPLLPFVPIMKGGDDKNVITRALHELRADEKLKELEMTLAFFATFVLSSPLIQQIMRWDMVVLRESPWYQEILTEGHELGFGEGHGVGFEEGRKQALEEGRLAAARLVLQILEHRFGEMPEEVVEHLDTLSIPALESLSRVALSATDLETFQAHPLLAS